MKRCRPEYVRLTPRPIYRKPIILIILGALFGAVRTLAAWPSKQQ